MIKSITAKVLFINPNKWGRGITTIWIASHSGVLKRNKFETKLFDSTFYKKWSDDELTINTRNLQFQQTDYKKKVKFLDNDIYKDLQKCIDDFKPDIIFFVSNIITHSW